MGCDGNWKADEDDTVWGNCCTELATGGVVDVPWIPLAVAVVWTTLIWLVQLNGYFEEWMAGVKVNGIEGDGCHISLGGDWKEMVGVSKLGVKV